ncbi:MAG: radical SAM protein [Phycisphaerae bacterium]
MHILLINPPWMTKDGNIWHGVKSTSAPLGLLYVAAYAEARGRSVHVMDVNAERLQLEDIERFVHKHQPPWVGFTAVTTQITNTLRVAAIVKRVSPESKTVVGGVHATALPEDVLKDPNVDYVIRGEGEQSFFALVDGRPLDTIGGLSFRAAPSRSRFCNDSAASSRSRFCNDSRPPPFAKSARMVTYACQGQRVEHTPPIIHNPLTEPIKNLDSLPIPAYHLIDFDLYKPAIGAYRRLPAINMTMTRGCPGKCIFCSSAQTPLRSRSAEHVVDEIQMLQARYGIREVGFYDDTFTIFKQNVVRMCELIVERGMDLTWCCFARADCVSPTLLKMMKNAGCHQVLFGIESADPEILRNIRKPINIEQTRRAVRWVKEAGIEVRAAFMFGNPGETVESMRRTIDFAKALDPDIAVFNITTPYPGTQLFDWAKKHGYLRTLDWNEYDLANSVMELPTVSAADINRMYKVAYREFFFRPGYLVRRFLRMRSLEDVRMNIRALRSVLFVRTTAPCPRKYERTEGRSVGRLEPVPTQSPVEVCT